MHTAALLKHLSARWSDCAAVSQIRLASPAGPVSLSLHLVGRHIAPVCHCWFHPAPVRTPGTDGSHQGGGVLFPAAVHHSGSDVRRDASPEIGRATSELQSLMRISYAVFCLKKKKIK